MKLILTPVLLMWLCIHLASCGEGVKSNPFCGNGDCEGDENCLSCREDCGCLGGKICNQQSKQCENCSPDCGERVCGPVPNGCGESCGKCDNALECNLASGRCEGECVPINCDDMGKECGDWDNGCGNVLDCGECLGVCDEGICLVCGEGRDGVPDIVDENMDSFWLGNDKVQLRFEKDCGG